MHLVEEGFYHLHIFSRMLKSQTTGDRTDKSNIGNLAIDWIRTLVSIGKGAGNSIQEARLQIRKDHIV